MSELRKTPLAEVRWCKLLGDATPGFDRSKPPIWSVEMLFSLKNSEHQEFLDSLEQIYTEEHGKSSRKSQHYLAMKPDPDNKEQVVVSFKLKQFSRKDGSTSEGPTIIDSSRNPWGTKLIGNGSKMIIAFDVYAWSGEAGAGITLQPQMGMVVDLVEYAGKKKATIEDFDPVPGGYVETEVDELVPF